MASQQREDSTDSKMFACVCNQYGPAEDDGVFEFRNDVVDTPTIIESNQILIENKYTTVNPADTKQRSGNLKLVMKHQFPFILGQDFAGVVVEVGSDVLRFKVGDEVIGSTAPRNGCGAQFVVADEEECAIKPDTLKWEEAVAIPTGYCTAWKGLFDTSYGNLPIFPEEDSKTSILIIGASGSVGSAAVQLAVNVAKCNDVVAICGSSNLEYAQSLGVTTVLDYKNSSSNYYETYLKDKQLKFDLVLDCVGGDEYYKKLWPYLDIPTNPNSCYVSCVGPVLHGGSEPITVMTLAQTIRTLLPRLTLGNWLCQSRYKLYLDFTTSDGVLERITKAFAESKISPAPRIDPTSPVPLKDLGRAHKQVEKGHSNGKVVIKICENEAPLT